MSLNFAGEFQASLARGMNQAQVRNLQVTRISDKQCARVILIFDDAIRDSISRAKLLAIVEGIH